MNSNNFSLIMPATCRAKGLKNENFRKIKNLSLVETLIKNPLNWKYLEA
jgi:CMP-N-acetylneuraminic acid synthetase